MKTLGDLRDPITLKAQTAVERLILEHFRLAEHQPGARLIRRRRLTVTAGEPLLDVLTVRMPDGEPRHVYFRIQNEAPEDSVPGLSAEHAIPVGSVAEEYTWLREVLGTGAPEGQEVSRTPHGPRDRISVQIEDEASTHIWFDISSFFGRRP